MKKIVTFIFLIVLTVIVNGQKINFCGCFPRYERETGIDIKNESKLPDFIKLKLDSIISIYYHTYRNRMKFIKARKYDSTLFRKKYNLAFNIPYIDVLYSLYIPKKGMSRKNNEKYCVLFSLDSAGNTVEPINLPYDSLKYQDIIIKKDAIELSQKLWQNKNDKIRVMLGFDDEKKYFVWLLTKPLFESTKENKDRGLQMIIINAHSGDIIDNRKYNNIKEFL